MAHERDRSLGDDEHERPDDRTGETREHVRRAGQRVAPNVPNYGEAPGGVMEMNGAQDQTAPGPVADERSRDTAPRR